jgi:Cof subfamily protein (haloacid dehalogenase superfamily)
MDLIFFDLDGTLLNELSEISSFTKETLCLLRDKDIAYTVATGRTMLSGQRLVAGHDFDLPQIYNNGVTIWDPKHQQLTLENLLDKAEVSTVIDFALAQGMTPFVNAIDHHHHYVFFNEPRHAVEKELLEKFFANTDAKLLSLQALPADSQVTNISMIGEAQAIHDMWIELNTYENLIAYSGPALEGQEFRWMDVHHSEASKGSAVSQLKTQLAASNVICFGDSDNDLSMFALADESYAPQNAKDEIKRCASAVIGHNHQDGIAHFLRERFSL